MKKILLAASAAVGAFCAPAHAATFTPAYEYTGAGTLTDSRPFTIGFDFSLSGTTSIDALGYNTLNIPGNQQVGIWDSAGTLLASATINSGNTVIGNYAWQSITTLTLGAGTYTIGGTYTGGPFVSNLSGVTSAPGFTWLRDQQLSGTGLNRPTLTYGNYGNNGIALVNFAGTFRGVPEPAAWAMMLAGFGLVGGAMRRRQKVAVTFA